MPDPLPPMLPPGPSSLASNRAWFVPSLAFVLVVRSSWITLPPDFLRLDFLSIFNPQSTWSLYLLRPSLTTVSKIVPYPCLCHMPHLRSSVALTTVREWWSFICAYCPTLRGLRGWGLCISCCCCNPLPSLMPATILGAQ